MVSFETTRKPRKIFFWKWKLYFQRKQSFIYLFYMISLKTIFFSVRQRGTSHVEHYHLVLCGSSRVLQWAHRREFPYVGIWAHWLYRFSCGTDVLYRLGGGGGVPLGPDLPLLREVLPAPTSPAHIAARNFFRVSIDEDALFLNSIVYRNK